MESQKCEKMMGIKKARNDAKSGGNAGKVCEGFFQLQFKTCDLTGKNTGYLWIFL